MKNKRTRKHRKEDKQQGQNYWQQQEERILCCPQCKEETMLENSTLYHPQFKSYFDNSRTQAVAFFEQLSKGRFTDWACDSCFETEDFILANIEKQKLQGYDAYPDNPIYLYKTDKSKRACKTCNGVITFTAQEQQFWYEKARIVINTKPKMCLTCRRKERERNAIAAPLKKLLKKIKYNPSKEDYQKITAIYERLEDKQKAGFYRQKARFFIKKS